MCLLKLFYFFFNTKTGRKSKETETVTGRCCSLRTNEIGQRSIFLPFGFLRLLTNGKKRMCFVSLFIIQVDVVLIGCSRKNAYDSFCSKPFFFDDFLKHVLRFVKKFFCFCASFLV